MAGINRQILAGRCLPNGVSHTAMSDGADQPPEPTTPTGPPSNEPGDALVVTGPFFQRIDWLSFALTTITVLVVYLWTLAPEVTLEFSGTLSTSAAYGGVAHPPGFPVWTLYSWLFAKLLPVSNIAWRVAVGSAVAAALACGLVALMVSRAGTLLLETTPSFTRQPVANQRLLQVVCGFVAGLAVGLSSAVWRIALIVETWALSILLFTIILSLLLRWVGRPERKRFLYGAFFVFGLLLTSNQEFLVMTPALLLLVLLGDRELGRDLSLAVLLLVFTVWAAGTLNLVARLNPHVLKNLRWIAVFLVLGVAAAIAIDRIRRVRLHWLSLFLVVLFLTVTDWTASALGLSAWFGPYLVGNVGLLAAFSLIGVAAAVAIIRTRRVGSERLPTMLCALLFLLGLGAYFYLPIASMTEPPANWGYARTVEGFFHQVTRGQYEPPVPTHELDRFLAQLWFLGREAWKGFGWPYFVFTALPVFFLHRTGRCARNWLLGLAAVLVCVGPLMLELLNPAAERASFELVNPYFGAMNVVLAVWTGLGLMVIGSIATEPRMQPRPNTSPGS